MKLVYPEWEKQIVWENGRYPVVALENRACHFRIVQELSEAAAGGDTRFVLSEGEHLLDMGRKAAFVPSPWSMDFSGRAVMTAFYSRIKKETQRPEIWAAAQETSAAVSRMAELLEESFPFPLAYDAEPDLSALMKAIHLQPEKEEGALAERMLAWMELCTELLGTACFFFCGFRGFMPEEELRGLYHTAFLKEYHFVLIENTCPAILQEEDVFTIDEDLCQIF